MEANYPITGEIVIEICCIINASKIKASDWTKSELILPRIIPAKAPVLQKMRECFSSLILIQKMVKAAAVIPQDWIIRLKSRATEGAIPGREVHSCSEMVQGYYSQPAMKTQFKGPEAPTGGVSGL